MLQLNEIYLGDCLELMKSIDDNSIDMILCDLPYGSTSNTWDSIIPLDKLWKEYSRICKGRIALFSAQPFTSILINSNLKSFKYVWTWIKTRPTGFQNAKKLPLRITEDICIFGNGDYYPQGLLKINKKCKNSISSGGTNIREDIALSSNRGSLRSPGKEYIQEFTNYPWNVLECGLDNDKLHPTQKPLLLCEYLIKTYTKNEDLVLDNCAGSGTTGIACQNLKRNYILMEKDEKYYNIAKERVLNNFNALSVANSALPS